MLAELEIEIIKFCELKLEKYLTEFDAHFENLIEAEQILKRLTSFTRKGA